MTDDPSLFDELDHRQCSRCGTIAPLNEFSATVRSSGSVKFGSYRRRCRTAYQREWYERNRAKSLAVAAALVIVHDEGMARVQVMHDPDRCDHRQDGLSPDQPVRPIPAH